MEVTDFDVRKIRYFAGNYCCNAAPFEDLVQEGWLAALGAKKPEHKYLAIRHAVQIYKKRATDFKPVDVIIERPTESYELMMIETIDQLKHLLEKANLTSKERECIDLIYLQEEKTLTEAGEECDVTRRAMNLRHASALNKLQLAAEKERRTNES